jgi:hypothetical protein
MVQSVTAPGAWLKCSGPTCMLECSWFPSARRRALAYCSDRCRKAAHDLRRRPEITMAAGLCERCGNAADRLSKAEDLRQVGDTSFMRRRRYRVDGFRYTSWDVVCRARMWAVCSRCLNETGFSVNSEKAARNHLRFGKNVRPKEWRSNLHLNDTVSGGSVGGHKFAAPHLEDDPRRVGQRLEGDSEAEAASVEDVLEDLGYRVPSFVDRMRGDGAFPAWMKADDNAAIPLLFPHCDLGLVCAIRGGSGFVCMGCGEAIEKMEQLCCNNAECGSYGWRLALGPVGIAHVACAFCADPNLIAQSTLLRGMSPRPQAAFSISKNKRTRSSRRIFKPKPDPTLIEMSDAKMERAWLGDMSRRCGKCKSNEHAACRGIYYTVEGLSPCKCQLCGLSVTTYIHREREASALFLPEEIETYHDIHAGATLVSRRRPRGGGTGQPDSRTAPFPIRDRPATPEQTICAAT